MNPDDKARLIYLGLVLFATLGGLLYRSRHRLGETLRAGLFWAAIIGGTTFVVSGWQGTGPVSFFAKQTDLGSGQIELKLQSDGHYYLTAAVNGVPVEFVVDTGASQVVLTMRDADRVGIDTADLTYIGAANTANGVVRTAPVRLETVEVGDIRDTDVRAVVNGGQMDGSLLGMSYLNRFEKIEIAGGKLVLTR